MEAQVTNANRIQQTNERIVEDHRTVENAMMMCGLVSDYTRMTVWGIAEREGVAAAIRYIETMKQEAASA